MTTLDLITKDDLEQFKTELFAELKKLGIGRANEQASRQWLKSAEVRKLLNISPGHPANLAKCRHYNLYKGRQPALLQSGRHHKNVGG